MPRRGRRIAASPLRGFMLTAVPICACCACVRALRRYVDILEPGRAMLREGHRQSAYRWFRRVAEERPEAALQQEAGYLAALALPDAEREAKEEAFRQATADTANPFYRRLLRQWAFTRLGWGDLDGAVDIALRCAHDLPDDETPQILAERLITAMHGMSPTLLDQALISLSRLPLTSLKLKSLPLESFAPLRGMALRALTSYSSHIDDLSPLQGMPLEQLTLQYSAINDLTPLTHLPLWQLDCTCNDLRTLTPLRGLSLRILNCGMNAITDLSPLSGMPLEILNCEANHIHDLWPLRGVPLQTLYCMENKIEELAPLRGIPLQILHCSNNRILNLSPLRGMPLQRLFCAANRITDLSPLRDMPLQCLSCAFNRIVDLSPLHDLPLTVLDCRENAITDLTPVTGLPLISLACGANPLTSLRPLAGMAIEDLDIEGIPLTPENVQVIRTLPLTHLECELTDSAAPELLTATTLLGVNNHTVAFVRAQQEILSQALAVWRHPDADKLPRPDLQRAATARGSVRYLALPLRFSRGEAEAFSRYYGGILACPATVEEFHALYAYLASIMYRENNHYATYYHLGIVADPGRDTLRWLSGAPYQWQNWSQPHEERPTPTATPYFVMLDSAVASRWWWNPNPHARFYTVIQWEG